MTDGDKKDKQPTDPLAERKRLTFEQAEGYAPLPAQLKQKEISPEFRAALWAEVHERLKAHEMRDSFGSELGDPWDTILRDVWVYRDHQPVDDFPSFYDILQHFKRLIFGGDWLQVLGWLEFVLKHPACPEDLSAALDQLMAHCRMAYRVFDGVVICPIGSEAERETIVRAFADLAIAQFQGARSHLRQAAELLTAGKYADSVRESIHAVEATARVLEPSAALSGALKRLEKSAEIHSALKAGFGNLYGYTSDKQGIRHPLVDDGTAQVDETDALFMIGACAAFVSYLINKARLAGILSGAA